MDVLYLITARGGSRGIPGKNLRQIGGLSLVGYKAIGGRRATTCARLFISTDDEEIRAEAERHGAEAPFLRPAELATDEAPSEAVVLHAMEWIEENTDDRYDAVMLLEPSSPFTRPEDYDAAVAMMEERDATLVVGMREVEVASACVAPLDEDDRITRIIDQLARLPSSRRQDAPTEYTMNGGLYLFRWEPFRERGQIYFDRENSYGHVMDPFYSVEIDEPLDLRWAEFLVERGHIDTNHWRRE